MTTLQASSDRSTQQPLDVWSAVPRKTGARSRLIKLIFGRPMFGFLLAPLCAVAACVGAVDRPMPVDRPVGVQDQSVVDDHLDDESTGAEVSSELDETPDVSSCIAQCGDDEGCRECCSCHGRPGCCF